MDNSIKHFVVLEKNDEGPLSVAIIDNINVRSSVSRQDFIERLTDACKEHFDADDIQLLDTPDKYTAPPHIIEKIEDMLQNNYWGFDVHIKVYGENGFGATLSIQETWFY